MKRLAATLLLAVTVGAPRGAAAKPSTLRVSLRPCAARIVDVPRLLAVLRIELTSSLGRPVAIVRADPADHRVAIDCDADSLLLDLARRQLAATWRGRILLDDVPRKLRPRTLALAIAEQFLALDLPPRAALPSPPPPAAPAATPPPPPPPPVSPSPPSPTVAAPRPAPIDVVATVPAPAPAPRRDTVRLTRNLAIGLSVASLAPLIIGGSLLAIGERDPSQPIQGLVVPGAILLGLGGAMLSGAGISFGLWLYEREQTPELTLAPLPGGLGVAWSGQF